MGRRDKGTGRVFKREDRGIWVAQLALPNGKYKYFSGRTKAIAAAKLEEARQRQKQGYTLLDEHLTVKAYLEDWLKRAPRRHHLEASTSIRYNNLLRLHVIERVGNVPLVTFAASAPMLRTLYNQLSSEPQPTIGRPLAASTVRLIHAVLRTALVDALNDELIARNVTDTIKPDAVKRQKKKYLTPVEAKKLLAQAEQEGDRFEVLYWVALNTGARESELLSLAWQDVLWDQGKLLIRKSKTEAGERDPGLIPQVLEKLRQHQSRLMRERNQPGSRWHDLRPLEECQVFPNQAGRKQQQYDFRERHFYPLLERAGLPRVTFHSLRRTAISWLLSLGIPVTDVAKYVGHADPAVTLRYYAESLPGAQQAILKAMEQAFFGEETDVQAVT